MQLNSYKCVECGKTFKATQQAKYCSPACAVKKQNKKKAVFTCFNCKREFQGGVQKPPLFCSHKCGVDFRKNNPGFNSDQARDRLRFARSGRPAMHMRICALCGSKFKPLQDSDRYCVSCSDAEQLKATIGQLQRVPQRLLDRFMQLTQGTVTQPPTKRIPALSQGQSTVSNCELSNREARLAKRRRIRAKRVALGLDTPGQSNAQKLRQAILSQRTAACQLCGFKQDSDALQIHHIDMDRSNNTQQNLIILCANCHAIFHTRLKRAWKSLDNDKKQAVVKYFYTYQAEVKERNKAGKPDRATRTEGCQEQQSGATHSDTSSPDMSHHEAALELTQF